MNQAGRFRKDGLEFKEIKLLGINEMLQITCPFIDSFIKISNQIL